MNTTLHRKELIHILHMAYSGEKAAAFAYAGHWRAVWNAEEKKNIARIEQEEWEHRAIVGTMLRELGSKPQALRELLMCTIGSIVFLACFIGGWFFPMYFAGRLESANVIEYVNAAQLAAELGLSEYAEQLLELSAVEQGHENYFKETVRGHWLTPFMKQMFHWGPESQLEDLDLTPSILIDEC